MNSLKDHDVYYDFYVYTILNNDLEEIFRVKTHIEKYDTHLDDFIYGCLPILEPEFGKMYGAIDETGRKIIKLSYLLDEVIKRISIIGFFSGSIKDEYNKQNIVAIFALTDCKVESTSIIDDFILNLFSSNSDIYEILFHLILYRDSYNQNKSDPHKRYFGDDLAYFQNRFDIYFILEYIKNEMNISKNIYLIYNQARDFNSKYFEGEILNYLPLNAEHLGCLQKNIEKRKSHLIQLCSTFSFVNFDASQFEIIEKKNMQKMKSASPFVNGRKVFIQEYLTIESNYLQKHVGNRFLCIYKQPAAFLDQEKYKNAHVLIDVKNSDLQYIVDGNSIKLCLEDFACTYTDYLELLK